MINSRTETNKKIWQKKPVLRQIYADLYKLIIMNCVSGSTLEIGGGSGNLKEFMPDIISTDICYADWLDLVADAQALPFKNAGFSNIVLFDVLHHIESPSTFFTESYRILRPGGRILLVEPAITFFSYFFYRFMHQEPVKMNVDPFENIIYSNEKDPYDGNQAIPTLIVTKYKDEFLMNWPEFKIVRQKWLSIFVYPLSGGFKRWSLIPEKLVNPLLYLDNKLSQYIGRYFGFRLFLVIEKS